MDPQLAELILRTREAGQVRRCHTLPHHGEYDVAAHSWHAATLLLTLWPGAPARLIRAVLLHDVGERYVGDVPATARWQHGDLLAGHSDLETMHQEQHFGLYLRALTDWELMWLRGVDALEFWMWCRDQQLLGNGMLTHPLQQVETYIYDCHVAERIPRQIWDAMCQLQGYTRTPDRMEVTRPSPPVPVEISCPECNLQHVDEGEWAIRPHKTHLCAGCGHEWKPFPWPTVGVAKAQPQVKKEK